MIPEVSDMGIQCCTEPITLRSVAVQTDFCKIIGNDLCKTAKIDISPPVQREVDVPQNPHAVILKIPNDHNYSMEAPPDAVIFPSYDADSFKTIPLPPLHKELVEDDKTVVDNDDDDDDNDGDDEDLDPRWQLPDDVKLLSGNDTVPFDHELPPEDEFEKGSPDSEKKILVFGSCLNDLLKRCPKWGGGGGGGGH